MSEIVKTSVKPAGTAPVAVKPAWAVALAALALSSVALTGGCKSNTQPTDTAAAPSGTPGNETGAGKTTGNPGPSDAAGHPGPDVTQQPPAPADLKLPPGFVAERLYEVPFNRAKGASTYPKGRGLR